MMKAPGIFLTFLFFCFFGSNLSAQEKAPSNKLSTYIDHFATFSNAFPQEKVYLHFDNTEYYLDETLWFKAYVVLAEWNALSPLSKTLYAELISPEGTIIETKKLKIENGQCHGDFALKDSLYAGFYEVRAYTRSMLNFDKGFIFSRVFPVYNKPGKEGFYEVKKMTARAKSLSIPKTRKEYDQKGNLLVNFFPEGGNLIEGLKSTVAFNATNKNGENVPVNGTIYDSKGVEVGIFTSSFQGKGTFEFTPGPGKYKAKVQYNDNDYTVDLPQALSKGYVMSVNNMDKEKISILIQKNTLTPNETIGLSISCRGRIYGSDQVVLNEQNELLLNLPKNILPSGVIQISLFNNAGEVLSERLVFVNHRSQMKMEVTQNKESYKPFEKVEMDFQLSDKADKPIETTFSVSVRDASTSSINAFNENILSNLLLSSEIKGYIENPGFYFESDSPSRRSALDLLLLTQGWSRYVWKQMAGVTPLEVKNYTEKGLVIEGSILSIFRKKKKENVTVSMILRSDSSSLVGTCTTDNEGKFNLALPDFQGKWNLILQTKENEKRKEYYILLDRQFSPNPKTYSFNEQQAPIAKKVEGTTPAKSDTVEVIKKEVNEDFPIDLRNHQLKEVTVSEKRKLERIAEGLANANLVYNVEDVVDKKRDLGESAPVLVLDFLLDTNPYFNYTESSAIDDSTPPICTYKGKPVVFVLNNIIISSNRRNIREILNDEIETIMISEKEGLYRLYAAGIAFDKISPNTLVIYLYSYKDGHIRTEPMGVRKTKIDGYAYIKEFYSPKYDLVILPDEKDFRRTIYWNPDVKSDEFGKAQIKFFSNGSCQKMNVSAETVTAKGLIGVINK